MNIGQKFISKNRAPRVHIEYAVELYGSEKKVQLPFVMGVIGDFLGDNKKNFIRIEERKFYNVNIDNFNKKMRFLSPSANFSIENVIDKSSKEIQISLSFKKIEDFSPDRIAKNVPCLSNLLKSHVELSNLLSYIDGKYEAEEFIINILKDKKNFYKLCNQFSYNFSQKEKNSSNNEEEKFYLHFLEDVQKKMKPQSEESKKLLVNSLKTFFVKILDYQFNEKKDVFSIVQDLISEIDKKLTQQINLILHHRKFQKLESCWKGLYYLVNNTETNSMLKIKIMSISKKELHHILKRYKGISWDQSPIFKKIYEEEYGQFGGEPFGCLIGDYYFNHHPKDIEILEEIAKIASSSHCPFISGASPKIMQMQSWRELSNPRDISKIFINTEYIPWNMLRESEDSRYLALTMPRILIRIPYGISNPVRLFSFEEELKGNTHEKYLWGNAAYAMAVNINRSFRKYGWCTSIRGVESGGSVEHLLCHTFVSKEGTKIKCPTETAISDRRESELSNNGFIPLIYRKNSDFAAFIGAQSIQKPAQYEDKDATANANLSTRLPYLFACCRFAHYLKCIVRDKLGSFQSRKEMENWLNKWIINYVDGDPKNSSQITKAKRPLAEAEVVILENSENPGFYQARFFLKPHYQLEGLTVSLRLVSRLPSLKKNA